MKIWMAAMALCMASAAPAQTMRVDGGAIRGETVDGITAFKGIPYAAAPIGDKRWRAPQPVRRWKGVRDATQFGADCAQAVFPGDAAPIATKPSEDCLFLNIWKPASAAGNVKLPVMLWIHGGGFVNGGSSPAVYSGANFARDGVIFVSINYRLGRFGFFAHPALADEGYGGNFGFLDQIAALRWIRSNIAAFGGDPDRVTVFGESAGGMSMHMLLQSPLARGLFSQVAIESGGGRDMGRPYPSIAAAAAAGQAFAPGLDARQLRALPTETVVGGLGMMSMGQKGYSGPMQDGRTLVGQPLDAIAAGIYPKVPVLVGANSADGFPQGSPKDKIFAAFGGAESEARALYDPQGSNGALAIATAISADAAFIEPARAVARALASRQPVFLYRFGHVAPAIARAMGGAPHASEIPFVFDTTEQRPKGPMTQSAPEDKAVATLTHRYWVNFARTGRPDGDGRSPAWPAAKPDEVQVQMIDAHGARTVEDPYMARLDFTERRAGMGR